MINNWIVEKPKANDARNSLELIIDNAAFNNIQSLTYGTSTVYVISEEIYKKINKVLIEK